MSKIIRFSTVAWVAVGVGLLGAAACNDDNEPSRNAYSHSSMFGIAGMPEGIAGAYSSTAWERQHFLCGVTSKGVTIAKNVPCTEKDPQTCYKTCGPYGIGYKQETCTGSAYAEDSMCNFWPLGNFSCFRIPEPDQVDPKCPKLETEAPRHGSPCDLEECHVCGGNSYEQTTGYRDQSQGLLKVGYCVCRPSVDTDGTPVKKWACATMGTAWPCPNGFGC